VDCGIGRELGRGFRSSQRFDVCKKSPEIYQNWRSGFLQFLDGAGKISERNLLDGDRYSWLNGYSLASILVASYDHHQEHLEKLKEWLKEHQI
jgi:hypothetical protein